MKVKIAAITLMLTLTLGSPAFAAGEHDGHGHGVQSQTKIPAPQTKQATTETHSHESSNAATTKIAPETNTSQHSGHSPSTPKNSNPDWPILYGFGAFNLIVLSVAAYMRYLKPKKEVK